MNNNHLVYLEILKCFLNETPFPEELKVNWPEILRLSQVHSTLGAVGSVAMANPYMADSNLRGQLRRDCLSEVHTYGQRAAQMDMRLRDFQDNGIDVLLMKGYVVKNYYPIPELRTFSDIDFVIRLEDRKKTDELMMKLDFRRNHNWEPVYDYFNGLEYYEIHTGVLDDTVSDKADFITYFSNIWDHVVQVEDHVYEFTPEFHLLYLLTHIAKHISEGGAGIRMYMDIVVFLRYFQGKLDWNWFCEEAEKLHFDDFVNMVFTAIRDWFDAEIPIPLKAVEQEVMDDFLAFTMDGGLFGKSGKDISTRILMRENRNDDESVSSKKLTILKKLFPSAKTLAPRYTYLQKMPFLLPFAWVHRLVITRKDWEVHKKQAQSILNADDQEVLRIKKMYKNLGL